MSKFKLNFAIPLSGRRNPSNAEAVAEWLAWAYAEAAHIKYQLDVVAYRMRAEYQIKPADLDSELTAIIDTTVRLQEVARRIRLQYLTAGESNDQH